VNYIESGINNGLSSASDRIKFFSPWDKK